MYVRETDDDDDDEGGSGVFPPSLSREFYVCAMKVGMYIGMYMYEARRQF